MDLESSVKALQPFSAFIPRERLRWIREHWSGAEPAIIETLKDAARNPEKYVDAALHVYAMYLAAERRSHPAYPVFLEICRLSEEDSNRLLGDILTEDMGRFLAAVCQDNIDPLKQLIEEDDVYGYSRSAAVDTLRFLVFEGRLGLDTLTFYHHHLLTQGLKREPGPVWDSVVCSCCDLHPGSLLEPIREAFQAGLVDPQMIGFEEVIQAAQESPEAILAKSKRLWKGPVGPVEHEITWMKGFQGPREKIEPNEPCPCGSGRKYKKCCMA